MAIISLFLCLKNENKKSGWDVLLKNVKKDKDIIRGEEHTKNYTAKVNLTQKSPLLDLLKKMSPFHWTLQLYLCTAMIYGFIQNIIMLQGCIQNSIILAGILLFVANMANIVFFFFILRGKGWALLCYFSLMLLQIPIVYLFGYNAMDSVITKAITSLAIISLMLLIRKKGVSAWSVLICDAMRMFENILTKREMREMKKWGLLEDDSAEINKTDNETIEENIKVRSEEISPKMEPLHSQKGKNQENNNEDSCFTGQSQKKGDSDKIFLKDNKLTRIYVGYAIWVFLNFAVLLISFVTSKFHCYPYIPNKDGFILPENINSTGAFFPFSTVVDYHGKYAGAVFSRPWDIACYDWTEFLVYAILPLVCLLVIMRIINSNNSNK